MHINYISNEKYLQMHLFSWQSIDLANIYHLLNVDSTTWIEYILLEEQMLSHNFFADVSLQDTEWLELVVVGDPKIKAACVSAGDSGNIP